MSKGKRGRSYLATSWTAFIKRKLERLRPTCQIKARSNFINDRPRLPWLRMDATCSVHAETYQMVYSRSGLSTSETSRHLSSGQRRAFRGEDEYSTAFQIHERNF